jgi:GNAT superfamily N-acetyltransferase
MARMAVVRSARTEDSRRLAEIHVTSWRQAYDGLLPPEFLRALSVESRHEWWSRRLDALEAGGAVLIVADSERETAEGFVFIGPCSVTEGEVYAIYVDPRRWRGGLGSELLAAAERTLSDGGFGQAILWVLEGNERGRSFYETRGWRPDGALKIEEIGGIQVTELRYRKQLGGSGGQLRASSSARRGESPADGPDHDQRANASNQLAGRMKCGSAF